MSQGAVALLSVGVPDAAQGGSGIFNELVCRWLLEHGFGVRAIFRVSRWFMETADTTRLDELAACGLEYELQIEEDVEASRWAGGLTLLRSQHQFDRCEQSVAEHRELLEGCEGVISLDLGWAWALACVDCPVVAILADPHFRRLVAMRPLSLRDRGSLTMRARRLAVEGALRGPVRRRLRAFDGRTKTLASFSPLHAAEYRRAGLQVRHVRWFAPGPQAPRRQRVSDPFRLLHVGALQSSASRQMARFWGAELLPALGRLAFPVELRLVGRGTLPPELATTPENVGVTLLGQLDEDSLATEYERAGAFLSPGGYPIGVRTRVVSALAHAIPVIADPTTARGLPELVADREIVYAASGAAIAAEVRRLRTDEHSAEEIGAAGRRAWERLFDPERNVPRLLVLAGLVDPPGEAMELVAEPEPVEGRPEIG